MFLPRIYIFILFTLYGHQHFQTYVAATFTEGFKKFLTITYGEQVATNLTRSDFGERGSFGGDNRSYTQKTRNTPVIFVHGMTNVAGDYHEAFDLWMSRNYTPAEIYSTTYGPQNTPINMTCELSCDYVKQIRQLIIAVSDYTLSKVFVIGNSLGGPISRKVSELIDSRNRISKAILGGKCVDTHEDLGSPLTERIASYLGVAGAMKGAIICAKWVSYLLPICNKRNGLYIDSAYINDTNSIERYESSRILIIESQDDDLVGFEKDGRRLLEVAGANKTIILHNVTHERTVFGTQTLQFDLLLNRNVSSNPSDEITPAPSNSFDLAKIQMETANETIFKLTGKGPMIDPKAQN
ncbi:hypothetical protein M3Y98_01204000 [Aphelenchoides besseyi]|nr:hypothetical protein M3Y98_01204000 [Aphelenchoides besseyi]KAI6193084.1 hypothetical protein M3Y96_00980600 [Aphelenchoides besseyi]